MVNDILTRIKGGPIFITEIYFVNASKIFFLNIKVLNKKNN